MNNKLCKTLIISAIIVTLMSISVPINISAMNEIDVYVNEKKVITDIKPMIISGKTLVPLRPVLESMGCQVFWNEATKSCNIAGFNKIVALKIGSNILLCKSKGGNITESKTLSDEEIPRINDGHCYIPLRVIGESFDSDVIWESKTKSVHITTYGDPATAIVVSNKIVDNSTVYYKGNAVENCILKRFNDAVYVPVEKLGVYLGYTLIVDKDILNIKNENRIIALQNENNIVTKRTIEGETVNINSKHPIKLEKGLYYLPIDVLDNLFDISSDYDEESNNLYIN